MKILNFFEFIFNFEFFFEILKFLGKKLKFSENFELLKQLFFLNFRILKIGKPRPEWVLVFWIGKLWAQRVLILGINTCC